MICRGPRPGLAGSVPSLASSAITLSAPQGGVGICNYCVAQTTGSDAEITIIDPSNNEIAGLGESPGPYPMLFP